MYENEVTSPRMRQTPDGYPVCFEEMVSSQSATKPNGKHDARDDETQRTNDAKRQNPRAIELPGMGENSSNTSKSPTVPALMWMTDLPRANCGPTRLLQLNASVHARQCSPRFNRPRETAFYPYPRTDHVSPNLPKVELVSPSG